MLEQACKNTFRHHFDTRVCSDFGVVANAVADGSDRLP